MDWRRHRLLLLFSATLIGVAGAAAQEGEYPEMTAEMKEEMAAWMKYAQPGPHHEHLQSYVGRWKGELKMWMAPDSEPMVDETTARVSWILGGRYLEWSHSGDFDGMPFEGRAIEAFNNMDDRYESTSADNFGTLLLYYTGHCADEGRTRVMTTEFSEPVEGGKISQRAIYTWIDADHFRYESWVKKGNTEFRNMVIDWARQ